MLSTRLWMGSALVGLAVGMLVVDQRTEGFPYPFQLAFQSLIALLACFELIRMFGNSRDVIVPMVFVGVLGLTVSSWIVAGWNAIPTIASDFPGPVSNHLGIWPTTIGLIVAIHLAIFLWEMAIFRESGQSFERMARTWWMVGYLGLLPIFFAQIRWIRPDSGIWGTGALALAIFVPKGCDIGAYCTGKVLGKHPMTPVLSPKKTWEGAIGGLAFAVVIAIAIDRLSPAPVLRASWGIEIAFGLTVGLAGMLGDLAESLIKRDCQTKDASQVVPGFGGVLDVVDAVIFAAPVAYAWFLALKTV